MSETGQMTLEEFRQLLDAHGAAEARWPQELRTAALALLEHDARARALLAEARALEALLSETGVPPAADELERRILAAAGIDTPETPPTAANDNARAPWWLAAPLAASLLLGVGLGLSGALQPVQQVLLAQADDPVLEAVMPVDDEEGGLL